jgi:hypothetical protein
LCIGNIFCYFSAYIFANTLKVMVKMFRVTPAKWRLGVVLRKKRQVAGTELNVMHHVEAGLSDMRRPCRRRYLDRVSCHFLRRKQGNAETSRAWRAPVVNMVE